MENYFSVRVEIVIFVIVERYGIRLKEYFKFCDNYKDVIGIFILLDNVLSSVLEFLNECNMEDEEDDDRDLKEILIFVFFECFNILYILGLWCVFCIVNMFIN